MKMKITLFLSVLLIFICCIGATSATENVVDGNLTVVDDSIVTESEDMVDNLQNTKTQDTTLEATDNEILNSGTPSTASNWTELATLCASNEDKEITLTGTQYDVGSNSITFQNSATIIGNANVYFTGGSSSVIPFICDDSSLSITFRNVNFRDMTSQMVMQLEGTSTLENCTFINIVNPSGRNSVVYNNYGFMNIVGCTFTNCTSPYGAVSNYNAASVSNVRMNVTNSIFENNYASTEPGAINNCGFLNVTNSTFTKNRAALWAGAINTYTNAETIIKDSTFTSNTAGWNGGALYTYSVLKVYNSVFEDNNCSTNSGGGAIGSYNFGSQYDILVENCTFKNNYNLYNLAKTKITSSDGRGGAIAVLNGGYLDVHNSIFVHNSAKWGQAICAYNQIVDNGTSDKPHLSICNNTFENHTYNSRDTVYINGIATAFENNVFINSPQTQYSFGNNNTYNRIILPIEIMSVDNNILGVIMDEDIIGSIGGVNPTIYVNASCDHDPGAYNNGYLYYGKNWDDAYGGSDALTYIFTSENANLNNDLTTIVLADGEYSYEDDPDVNLAWYNIIFEGYGNNVIFKFNDGYNIDNGDEWQYAESDEDKESKSQITTTYKNIIFDCSVTVGSQTNKFIGCTFNDDVKVTNICGNNMWSISFENCTFLKNAKDEIQTPEGISVTFDNDCSFKQTIVDSKITISNETDIIIVTLTDAEGNPIKGATVNYNTTTGVKESNITGEDGTFTISGLTGEFTINATYAGNESYNPSNNSASFNFKLPAVETTLSINSTEKGIVTITVKDAEGKPVANAEIKYNNGGENTTKTTNNEGIVTVSGLTGEGEIKAYFEGNDTYLKSEGSYKYNFTEPTPTPDTNSSTNGTSGNGTSTNSTGNATSGNGTSTNTGTTTNTPKVTKKATKITAKKKTFKAKKKTKKYTIVLKAGKAAVKKVKVTLKVGKKTYKATTNSKGKATFKITKLNKKGKYTAVIKFKGNKNYKATTKKVKITIKK